MSTFNPPMLQYPSSPTGFAVPPSGQQFLHGQQFTNVPIQQGYYQQQSQLLQPAPIPTAPIQYTFPAPSTQFQQPVQYANHTVVDQPQVQPQQVQLVQVQQPQVQQPQPQIQQQQIQQVQVQQVQVQQAQPSVQSHVAQFSTAAAAQTSVQSHVAQFSTSAAAQTHVAAAPVVERRVVENRQAASTAVAVAPVAPRRITQDRLTTSSKPVTYERRGPPSLLEIERHPPKVLDKPVTRMVEVLRPVPVDKVVERLRERVEVTERCKDLYGATYYDEVIRVEEQIKNVVIERLVHKEVVQEVVVDKVVDVVVEVIKEVPVTRVVEKKIEIIKEVPQVRYVDRVVTRNVPVTRIVERVVEVIKEVPVETIKEVPVYVKIDVSTGEELVSRDGRQFASASAIGTRVAPRPAMPGEGGHSYSTYTTTTGGSGANLGTYTTGGGSGANLGTYITAGGSGGGGVASYPAKFVTTTAGGGGAPAAARHGVGVDGVERRWEEAVM